MLDFVQEYKRVKKIDSSTKVLLYALETLKRIYEDEKKDSPEFKTIKMMDAIFTPKDKLLDKVENDFQFRKKEYEVVQLLSNEQQKDYLVNYQEFGMSIQDYYNSYIKGEE